MINCAVIDDEPLARECLVRYIQKVDFLHLVGEGSNPTEVYGLSKKQPLDLIFLDIQMPVMTGMEYLKSTTERPIVILTTAYPSYALEGFELDVLDYMVKPITFDRFFKGAHKAKDYFLLRKADEKSTEKETVPDYFFVKCEHIYERIIIDDVEYVQALQNYVIIYTASQKYMTLMPMKRIEVILGTPKFIRVHKSYIVAVDKIRTVENSSVKLTKETIPVSRSYRKIVFQHVVNTSLLKK